MGFSKKTIDGLDVAGKRVFVRVDFNVPQDETGAIADDRRIKAALPTIKALISKGARVILASHLGRPKGGPNPKYTLAPVAARLSALLGQSIAFADESVGEEVEGLAAALKNGQVLLLENVRFHPEEEKNGAEYAAQLAKLADIYVDDAFGTSHRAHASTEGVPSILKSQGKPAVAGYLLKKELDYLGSALDEPKRPFVAILGGAKVKDKIAVIEALLPKVDKLIIVGGMAYTFYKGQGLEIGQSLLDENSLDFTRRILIEGKGKIELPSDSVVGKDFSNDTESKTVKIGNIPADFQGLDIGPETIERFTAIIKTAKTVLWNGPAGVFEFPNFAVGTRAIAEALKEATEAGATTIVGGGDSAAAVEQLGFADSITHISTGGGASLEFLEGKVLPGVNVLDD
jgi:phosphoglycerate kinase